MKLYVNAVSLALSLALFFCQAPARASVTDAGQLEVMQTMATIAYQAKDFARCRQILNDILKKDHVNVAARELLALTQKEMKDESAAARTYQTLLETAPPSRHAAYHFELGMIRYRQKKLGEARRHLDLAARLGFNGGTSNFYLGLMDFKSKSWAKARSHLSASLTYSDGKPMAPITRYYLASAYAQLGKSDAAVHNYYEADRAVEAQASSHSGIDDTFKGIRTSALKELRALDKNQRYASITLMQQFDSNVQTNPSEVANPIAASSERSAKSVLSISAGYSTSPTRELQITPSFNYYTNYNYNYLARNFNFMTFTPAVFAVYKPYARLSAGLKADGIFSMQNMLDPEESQRDLKYRPFSLTADIGPVFKYELTPKVILGAETYFRPTRFYLDPATGDSRRSGGGTFSKLSADYVSGLYWWNPTAYISFEWVHSAGKDFRDYAWGGGLANTMSVTDKLSLTGSWDIVSTDYTDTRPKRDDLNMVFRVAATYPIVDHWSATADASYTTNNSSLSTTYKYNRWVGDVGATYSF